MSGASLAVLCLDLDYFKQANDTFGHPIGDALLCAVGRRLREYVRETDIVARLGGDEFAILQIGVEQPVSASLLAQQLVDAMVKPFGVDGHEIAIGTSIGISVAPNDSIDADYLLKSADMALYRTKEHGRSGFSFFEPKMDAEMQERRTLEMDLRKAVAVGEFELFYQPVMTSRRRHDLRLRGAIAMEPSDAWHGFAGDIHSVGRGNRSDHRPRRMGATTGLCRGGQMAQ